MFSDRALYVIDSLRHVHCMQLAEFEFVWNPIKDSVGIQIL